MKYSCQICSYIYNSNIGDPEKNATARTDLKDLPENWVCPQCGVGKEEFFPLKQNIPNQGEFPMALMILALTKGLWTISGKGSYSVTKEIGRTFIQELKKNVKDISSQEIALESIKEYFINQNKFARNLEYVIREETVELNVENCRFFGLCKQLESQGVLITTCPYTNTTATALEEVTGYRYRIDKEQKDYGHHITLKRVSKVR
ncbi:rubredoxin [Methanobacterium alcaliphilum]|uniref:rubredoxin n=1 Tax=Methanobacterium alcaliphilum TaxID=392018 RepID=UPI00200A7D1B|nr:rubredoxin [Methanobacterium alcaliphilum]MCK9151073.1 rubredoxin [Methanobacterium alcaliphilum]